MSTTYPAAPARRLFRSRTDRHIGGVCGGIAQAMGWDPNIVRLVAVASILLPGPQVLAYLILWMVLPEEPAYQPDAAWAPASTDNRAEDPVAV